MYTSLKGYDTLLLILMCIHLQALYIRTQSSANEDRNTQHHNMLLSKGRLTLSPNSIVCLTEGSVRMLRMCIQLMPSNFFL